MSPSFGLDERRRKVGALVAAVPNGRAGDFVLVVAPIELLLVRIQDLRAGPSSGRVRRSGVIIVRPRYARSAALDRRERAEGVVVRVGRARIVSDHLVALGFEARDRVQDELAEPTVGEAFLDDAQKTDLRSSVELQRNRTHEAAEEGRVGKEPLDLADLVLVIVLLEERPAA